MALTRITKGVIKPNENYDTHNINSTGIVTSVGLDVNGNADISGSLSVGGVLTYEDVTSIDSVGIITAQKDIHVGAGISVVGVGSFGSLDISGDIDVDGHTNLDNVSIAGVTTTTDNIIINADSKILKIGASEDIHIFHQGGYSIIKDINDNPINIQTDGEIKLAKDGNAETYARFIPDGAVELYHNNSKKLETSAKGIQVGTGVTIETNGQATYTGIITATAFKLADGSAIGAGAGGTWRTYTAGIATTKSVGINTNNLDDNDLVGVGNSFQGLYISNGMMITDNSLHGNHYIGTAFNGLMAGPVTIEGTLPIDGNYVVV